MSRRRRRDSKSAIFGGNVRVRTGEPGSISVSIDEHREAPDEDRFEKSLYTLNLDVEADARGVSIVVGGPERRWQQMDRCRGCRVDYQFDVLVPPGTEVDVGTVMDGRIDVAGINGAVSASNVNGPVSVLDARECRIVESVNGPVDLRFSGSPSEACSIDSINGDITLELPAGAGLDVMLDMFNGRLVSELSADTLAVPARIEQTQHDGRSRYRIEQAAGVRLGPGGPTFSISSLNGDVRIQKTQ